MMKIVLILAMMFFSFCSKSQKNENIELPVNIISYKLADIFEITFTDDIVKDTTHLRIYGYDRNKNLIYNIDSSGLFLEYKYDSINNLKEALFYEDFDTLGKRRLSAKWIYEYENNLRARINRYKVLNDSLMFEESVSDKYELNDLGQIILHKYFDKENKLKETVYSEYLDSIPSHKKFYDFSDEGRITKYYCSKEITQNPSGETIDSTIYTYDTDFNLIKKIVFNVPSSRIKVEKYKYDIVGNIIEETLFFGTQDQFFIKRIFEYSNDGFRISYTSINSNGKFNWIRRYYYR